MNFPPEQLESFAQKQLEHSRQRQLEAEIALVRQEIAQLKHQLKHSFDQPGGFVAIGEELRQATERLRLMEAELKTRKLEAREEVWWCSHKAPATSAATLTKPSRYSERWAGR